MSIEGIGRASERIAEISSRFGGPDAASGFHDLLVEAAAGSTPDDTPSVSPSVPFGPALTIGQMLGMSVIDAGPMAPAPGRVIFPVAGVGPDGVTNSFGWPWGDHKHAGVDIFAPTGTPVLAPVSGEIEIANAAGIGGNRVWLRGDDGRGYYLAHLDGFADGITPGVRVGAGEVVGYVGSTGDAAGKPAHLHFAISRSADLKPGDTQDPAAAGWLDPAPFLGLEEADHGA